jgi:hypothetical protein
MTRRQTRSCVKYTDQRMWTWSRTTDNQTGSQVFCVRRPLKLDLIGRDLNLKRREAAEADTTRFAVDGVNGQIGTQL